MFVVRERPGRAGLTTSNKQRTTLFAAGHGALYDAKLREIPSDPKTLCFWDNKLRSESPERFIGWRGRTLRIADLRDGSNLAAACTQCHTGNNVYLIAPDDPTWAKVLRGPLEGTRTGTFTTVVEASSEMRDGHPRYIPITTLPPRTGWENTFRGAGCAGACHEMPVGDRFTFPTAMPPACARTSGVAGCYGTP